MRCLATALAVQALAALTLSGCTAKPQRSAAGTYLAAVQDCKANWPKLTRQSAIPRAACIGDAETTYLVPQAGPNANLVAQRTAFRNELAAHVASGEMTPLSAAVSMSFANSQLAATAHARMPQKQLPDGMEGPDGNGLQ
jgi:hypothetical protein